MNFQPTYLYIKRHTITGKCYFGKTYKSDPITYLGSGKLWKAHIKKYGKTIETLWYKLFTDKKECIRTALLFSEQQNIVKSDLWLNFKPENGLDGSVIGHLHSKETRIKMSKPKTKEARKKLSISRLGKKFSQHSPEASARMSAIRKGKSIKHRIKISEAMKNVVKVVCPNCNKEGHPSIMSRWHFDNCQMFGERK